MPYTAFQAALDPLSPYGGGRFYARGEYLPGLSDGAIVSIIPGAELVKSSTETFAELLIEYAKVRDRAAQQASLHHYLLLTVAKDR